jgi:peptidoglycan/xylan/chitin deacetylase (PgdA/CDA1 family)
MRAITAFAAALTVAGVLHAPAAAEQQRDSRPARLAITFDDLPVHAALPPGVTRAGIAARTVEALQARRSPPVYGFVNAKGVEDEPDASSVLTIWRDAGFPLANHGFAHVDLHATTAEAFERDITRNEPTLQSLMPHGGWRWFRYPFLNEGDTPAKGRRVADFLAARGYRTAPVTLSFDDWAYGAPYARCAAARDQAAIDWLKASYMRRAGESLSRGQQAARALFGRDIDHILLLHIGAFTALMLPDVLDLLDAHGFQLITLDEAAADPAYRTTLPRPPSRSGTLLDQLMSGRNTSMPPWQEDPLQRLTTICQ